MSQFSGGGVVLLVEDAMGDSDEIRQILKGFNLEMRHYQNAEVAWLHFKNNWNGINMVIVGLTLITSGMSGVEFVRRVRTIDRTFPVAVITGNATLQLDVIGALTQWKARTYPACGTVESMKELLRVELFQS